MTQDDTTKGLGGISFSKFFEKRQKEQQQTIESTHPVEPKTPVAIDGRISSKSDQNGNVQLNVRVPIAIKDQVLEERARRKTAGLPQADVSDIVAEALQKYLSKVTA